MVFWRVLCAFVRIFVLLVYLGGFISVWLSGGYVLWVVLLVFGLQHADGARLKIMNNHKDYKKLMFYYAVWQ